MPNRTFSIAVNAPVKTRNGLYKVAHHGDVYISYDRDTMTIESIMYCGINILPLATQIDANLDYYYTALEAHEEYLWVESDEREENEAVENY